jgi:hypothetical protein
MDAWNSFQNGWQQLFAQAPTMTVAGSQEIDDTSTESENSVAYRTRFAGMAHEEENAETGPLFYSYDVGSVHVIVLSSYSPSSIIEPLSPQTLFLIQDLNETVHRRKMTPWVIVAMNAPMYTTAQRLVGTEDVLHTAGEAMRRNYENIFLAYRVNAVFSAGVSWRARL